MCLRFFLHSLAAVSGFEIKSAPCCKRLCLSYFCVDLNEHQDHVKQGFLTFILSFTPYQKRSSLRISLSFSIFIARNKYWLCFFPTARRPHRKILQFVCNRFFTPDFEGKFTPIFLTYLFSQLQNLVQYHFLPAKSTLKSSLGKFISS